MMFSFALDTLLDPIVFAVDSYSMSYSRTNCGDCVTARRMAKSCLPCSCNVCRAWSSPLPNDHQGFTDNSSTFLDTHADAIASILDALPICVVVPLSRATVNETAINNGDVKTFGATFFVRETG